MRRLTLIFLAVLPAVSSSLADTLQFRDGWFASPPTAGQVSALVAAAPSKGWSPIGAALYQGALSDFETGHLDTAEAWYYVGAWFDLLGHSQSEAGRRWLDTVARAGLLNANTNQKAAIGLPDQPMANLLSPDTLAWVTANRAFSAEFFDLISEDDYVPGVLHILTELHDANPARFAAYNQLALAIAVVYDSPPPDNWPHGQVTTRDLTRRLPTPLDAFNFFVDSDQHHVTLQRLSTLPASVLKFTVDLSAPFSDLQWAQRSLSASLDQLSEIYGMVRYDTDRLKAEQYVWRGGPYTLPRIYSFGGICVDQAYFATQAGKALGVPTLLFAGDGQDGRHAWFGYLGSDGKWVLDAGRYPEEKFVTGVAFDPQTWGKLSDHDLQFLTEGFRQLPSYKRSRQYELFANLYLNIGFKQAAAAAARKAVDYEPRNFKAWKTLLAASSDAGYAVTEPIMQRAAMAFQAYPDLNALFIRRLADSLRSRGEGSAADLEERQVARKNQNTRTDLTIDQAVTAIDQVLKNTPLPDQVRVYRQVLQQYGFGGGMDFYDRVVRPFVDALLAEGYHGDAKLALREARDTLKPDAGSQLDLEMKELADSLRF